MSAQPENSSVYDIEEYRDHIATVDEQGKRVWIYPKKPKGRFTNARTLVSGLLLAFLFVVPFIKVHGEPLLLFNVLERKFILFGILFLPQDFHLFVLAMLTLVLFIVLFTVVWGRLFCGWVCPQTIFMEMVFRKIEYWIEGDAPAQRRLNKAPWNTDKIIKKTAKQAIFFAIAVLIANVFLAYIISADEVLKIIQEPVSQHVGGFVAMLIFSTAFYLVFSTLREQVCVTICPYGRLQGVLLDQNSIVVAYDFVRGEPRGKIRKNQPSSPSASIQADVKQAASQVEPIIAEALPPGADPLAQTQQALGDCIDCKLCIAVCPTGIDIRNGTQLECVNCTACIDACDEVMDKVDRPRGLIRYDSHLGIKENRHKLFTPRVIAYTAVLAVLLAINVILLGNRSTLEVLMLRAPGMLYQEVDATHISNLYNYQLINKSTEDFPVEFKPETEGASIRLVGKIPQTQAGKVSGGALFIDMEKTKLSGHKTKIKIGVYREGKKIDQVSTNFLGPLD